MKNALTERLSKCASASPGGVSLVISENRKNSISIFGSERIQTNTLFPLASATKPITGLLLVMLESDNTVERGDSISIYLPVEFTDDAVANITLEQLALHTSGLPKLPTNLDPSDEADPYADYKRDDLYAFLSENTLDDFDTTPGEKIYSNIGYALLGHVLELAADKSYDQLLQKYICQPLDMKDTTAELDSKREDRLAIGHDENGREVSRWHSQIMKGDGAIITMAEDMQKLLSAIAPDGKFFSHIRSMYEPYQADEPGLHQVLGWMHSIPSSDEENTYLAKGGESAGYQAFVGVSVDQPKAVTLLANCKLNQLSAVGTKFLSAS